jgi:hypothetical protein
MVQLAVWLLVCTAVAWLLRDRVAYAVAAVIIVWSAVPAVGGHHLIGVSGSGIAFHPASWLVLAVFAVQLVMNPQAIGSALARHYLVMLAVIVFAIGALLTSRLTASGGTRLLVDQIVGPFLLFWLIVADGYGRRPVLLVVRNAILLAMAAQSVLAIVQLALGRIIFYESDYLTLPWFKPETFVRWMGTADSPLVLSLGVCVAGALAVGLRSAVLRFSLLGLFLIATIITQSRTGAAVMSLIIVYAIIRSQMVLWARALASVAVVGLGYYLAGSAIISGLAARFGNDTGSANARALAAQFVFDNIGQFLLTGQGLISSYTIARNAGLQTSLENSYLMYVIDTGLLLATLYFGTQLAIAIRYGVQRTARGVTLAALVGTLLQHTFSAVAFANFSGTLIWAALGLVVVAWTIGDDPASLRPALIEEPAPTARPVATPRRRALRPRGVSPTQSSEGAPAAASVATSSES